MLLKRLRPGNTSDIPAMQTSDGHITPDPTKMAEILNAHWSKAFTRKDVCMEKLRTCLRGIPKMVSHADLRWELKHEHVAQAIDGARDSSSPGPDGIPFSAWKKLKGVAVQTLLKAAKFLGTDDSLKYLASDFNHAFLTCLPKKASGYDDDGRAYFEPGATRPLSVVNTDNRLIASAYKKVIEPLANEWVSSMQQGFLEGRSMLRNVVDIDLASMKVAMQHRNGMLILFDFTAAFPSLSRESMFEILQSIGMPPHMLQAIRCLYANNYHTLKLKG